MNKLNAKVGLWSVALTSVGVMMKVFHVPASVIPMLLGGVGVLFVTIPAFVQHVTSKQGVAISNMFVYLVSTLLFLGVFAKLFHVPAANLLLGVALLVGNVLLYKVVKAQMIAE